MTRLDPRPQIRPATAVDVPLLLTLIRELAEYERLSREVVATPALLRRWLFGPRPAAEAVVARAAGEPVGFALFFTTYSTFVGRPGLWLEDLYVRPSHRGKGLGRELLAHVAGLAHKRGYGRVEWSVLDWNESAIGFYKQLGARPLDDWTTYRLDGKELAAAARTGRATARAYALTAARPSASSRGTPAGWPPTRRTPVRRGCAGGRGP